MKYLWVALIYFAFYGLIAFALWMTSNPNVLWALLLSPGIETLLEICNKKCKCKCEDKEEVDTPRST